MAWTKIKTAAVIGVVALSAVGTTALLKDDPDAAKPSTVKPAANAAYATPDATIKTLIAALEASDTRKFAAACTPEKAAQFNNQNIGKSEAALKAESSAMAKAFSKFEITKRVQVSPTEMLLHVKALGDSPNAPAGDRNVIMKMVKLGNDWKYDGEQR